MAVAKSLEGVVDKIINDPAFVKQCIEVMSMEADIDEDYLVPFTMDDEDDDGNPIVRERKGDYGNMITYVPVKYIRERARLAFKGKYSFLIIAEHREENPFDRQRYNREEEEYETVDGDRYLKCIGMMIVPGLGIRMGYGVKKVFGGAESTDWKACHSDAFKKCCEAFGIYLDVGNPEDDSDESAGSSSKGGNNRRNSKNADAKDLSDLDLSDVEYDEDELEDAQEFEVKFSKKYPNWTMGEIAEEDIGYVIWIYNNGRDDDAIDAAAIVLKNAQEEEESRNAKRGRNRSSGRGKSSEKSSSKTSGRSSTKRGSSKSSKSKKSSDDDDLSAADRRKRDKLIALCDEAMEDYDKVQRQSCIGSVSISPGHRNGKTKLEDLTLRELEELADILSHDE